MPKTKDVDLLDPFEHHNSTIGRIRLKEPSGGQFAMLGEPRIWIRNAVGGYWVEQPEVIRQYLDKLIDHQDGAELLKLMSLADSMQVKDQLLGFFADAEARLIARKLESSPSA